MKTFFNAFSTTRIPIQGKELIVFIGITLQKSAIFRLLTCRKKLRVYLWRNVNVNRKMNKSCEHNFEYPDYKDSSGRRKTNKMAVSCFITCKGTLDRDIDRKRQLVVMEK